MNNDNPKIKLIDKVCPICSGHHQTPEKAPAPTCGRPSCIRTARALGMPITPLVPTLEVEPEITEQPAGPKRRKKEIQKG